MLYKKHFKQFVKDLDSKMDAGYHEYGDKSFKRPPKELLQELEEEVLDICGWSLILYVRLKELKKKLRGI